MQRRLAGDGITLIGQLARLGERGFAARYGGIGAQLGRLAHGEDDRIVDAHALAHSISVKNHAGARALAALRAGLGALEAGLACRPDQNSRQTR